MKSFAPASYHVTGQFVPGNPHPQPKPQTIAALDTRVLIELVALSRRIPPDRQWLAGIPAIDTLRSELVRREVAL